LIVFHYSGRGFRPARIRPEPLTDVSAITLLGERLVEKRPVLKEWKVPSPSRVQLDPASLTSRPYSGIANVRLAHLYPIVEAYQEHVAVGLNATFTDPLLFHEFGLSASWTPESGMPMSERPHVRARYKRYDLALQFRWNPASFYDLVGPRKTSRKGYGSELTWHRTLLRDPPRNLDWNVEASHWGALDRLPDHQNVSTGPGFDQLLSVGTGLHYKNLRTSMGAPDFVKGVEAWLSVRGDRVRSGFADSAQWRGHPFVDGGGSLGTPVPGLKNSSLWLRGAAGYSPGDPDDAFANFYFGRFGNNWLDHQEPKRYRDPYSFPGVPFDAVSGTDFAHTLLEWNLPALRFRRAGTLAFYASWMRVSFFAGGLVTNLGEPSLRRELSNAGGQADIRFQLLTQAPLTLSFGYAQAVEQGRPPSREWMVSLKVL
jgi:hypothetical protein